MTSEAIIRPSKGFKARIAQFLIGKASYAFAVLRRYWPIARLGSSVLVTRYDDVREVFESDADFPVIYNGKLKTIMGGEPFFLGMGDTADYRRDTDAMRMAVKRDDISARLIPATNARAEALVAAAPGKIEVVAFSRDVTFDVLCPYFGISDPPGADLKLWATRLFEFQFADQGDDAVLDKQVESIAPALRAHIDGLIAARPDSDDVLGRCLTFQAQGLPGFSDTQIRSALIGFLVGGLPQPPMVVPQALNQLLNRPEALAGAQAAAHAGDDALLAGYVFEALRFDPLAPALMRTTANDHVIAAGTRRATNVKAGTGLLVSFASAMMDPRRLPDPAKFDPRRLPHEYMHFGHGLHTCFGLYINRALLPLMLKPLLKKPGLRRGGALRKAGPFAERLVVAFD